MDKPDTKKGKNRKSSAKPKSSKKKCTDGPACSMFLVELSRKLAQKKREEQDAPKNIVASILDSLTNAIPIIIRKTSPPQAPSPVKIETLQTLAPELIPSDTINILPTPITSTDQESNRIDAPQERKNRSRMPKMPVISSEVFKPQRNVATEDVACNTNSCHDMASHLSKYVDTLKKISLIAEEFNQKTAKNLKEIVDSVQEDLKVKLKELEAEQKLNQPLEVAQEDIEQASCGTSH